MKRHWILKGAIGALLAVLVAAALSAVVMALWNWLVPAIIGWKAIDFWQAFGLLVLTRILFGLRIGMGRGRHWRGRMAERWERMTPEERGKFREGMRSRCRHRGWDRESSGSGEAS
jgi:hypothetical protein